MSKRSSIIAFLVLGFVFLFGSGQARGQASGAIEGVVKDPSGGVVPNATVEISYSISGYEKKVTTGPDGAFRFTNVPFNTYHMVVTVGGFANFTQDVDVRTAVPVNAAVNLTVGSTTTSVNVEANGGDLVENESGMHSDIDRKLFERTPLESSSSPFSSLVTLTVGSEEARSRAGLRPPLKLHGRFSRMQLSRRHVTSRGKKRATTEWTFLAPVRLSPASSILGR